jgi:electron transfer flavoprotein alpha subunit
MRALVFVETFDREPTQASLGVLSHAALLTGEAAAVVCGAGAELAVEAVARHGATRVYVADLPELTAPLPQPWVDALAALVDSVGFDTVMLAASGLACDVAGGLANRLQAGVNWDLIDLELRDGASVGKRLALQDSVLVEVGWLGKPCIAVFRPGALKPVDREEEAELKAVAVEPQDWSLLARRVGQTHEQADSPSIDSAEILVAGGRGVGGKEGFALLRELADELGGGVSASLPAVEIGWYPSEGLVGQSGKVVQPKLYLACGISGAVQHKIGMENSATIIAINKDPAAPIFDFCDVAVVGDLFEVVPKLTELLRARRDARSGAPAPPA